MKLGFKLVSLIALLLFGAEAMLMGLCFTLFAKDKATLVRQLDDRAALDAADELKESLDGIEERMHDLVEVARSSFRTREGIAPFARRYLDRNPEFLSIHLYELEAWHGIVLRAEEYAPAIEAAGVGVAPREEIEGHLSPTPGPRIFPLRLGDRAAVAFALPLGDLHGFLVATVASGAIERQIATCGAGEVSLFDGLGTLVFHCRAPSRAGNRLLASMSPTPPVMASVDRHAIAIRIFEGLDLRVAARSPETRALISAGEMRVRAIAVALGVLILSLLGGYLFSETIASPLRGLMGAIGRVGAGDYSVRVPASGSDEISQVSSAFNVMTRGLEERARLRTTIMKFHDRSLIDRLLSGKLRIVGERQRALILSVDIRGFTAASEKLAPEAVIELLNEYLGVMVETIHAHGGVVDKFIGDGIMALWGVPMPSQEDTERAVRCCLELRQVVTRLNRARRLHGEAELHISMGLNAGDVIAGNVGSPERMEYTVIGDAVSLASRIEGMTKELGTDLLVARSACEAVQDRFVVQSCGAARLPGKSDDVELFKIFGYRGDDGDWVVVPDTQAA